VSGNIIFDIETGPRNYEDIKQFEPPLELKKHPGEFDKDAVKLGGRKDPDKIADKIAADRAKHEAAVKKWEEERDSAAETSRLEFLADAALSAITGEVLAVGFKTQDKLAILHRDKRNEIDIIEAFWDKVVDCTKTGRRLIGFNIYDFDLTFMIRRSWYHRVEIPAGICDPPQYYWNDVFIDLRHRWACSRYAKFEKGKLDQIGRFLTGRGKTSTGDKFAALYSNESTRGEALKYLATDLEITFDTSRIMGLT